MKFSGRLEAHLKEALLEDIGKGDVTSRLLISRSAHGRAVILAKEAGVFCGGPLAKKIFKMRDKNLSVAFRVAEGGAFSKGRVLAEIRGRIIPILEAERTALNFLGRLCGIATKTDQFVRQTRPFKVRILDTRKTTPLWRELEKYAVRTGGGQSHRMGLFDEVFVKENHRRFGNLQKLKKVPRRFILEIRNQRELAGALALKPRVILLDNFSPAALKKAVKITRKKDPRVILEASGGVTLQNLRAFAASGVHQISVGSLTHSVRSLDLSLLVR